MKDDEELINDYLAGDESAFGELVGRHAGALYGFIVRLAGTREEAEDVVQEAFFRAWKAIGRFDRAKKFKPWLFAITYNTAIDMLRKKRPRVFSDMPDPGDGEEEEFGASIPDPEPLPDELFRRTELSGELERALRALSPERRSILTLHYTDELSFAEIALIVGKPMNTVKSLHRRALQELRRTLLSPGAPKPPVTP